jgi:dienelactone hydrolase
MPRSFPSWTRPCLLFAAVTGTLLITAEHSRAQPPLTLPAGTRELTFTGGLAVGLVGAFGRSAVQRDLLAWQLATGSFREPAEGLVVGSDERGREQAWTAAAADTAGWIQHRALRGGYLWVVVDSERARTMILEAAGYYVVHVNGEPRGGEKYGYDWVRHPVVLKRGRNTFLFQGERGRIRARLTEPPAPVFFTESDITQPDLVIGEAGPVWVGIRLVNTTAERLAGIEVSMTAADRRETVWVEGGVAPLTTRKLSLLLSLPMPAVQGSVPVTLQARVRAGRRTLEVPAFALELSVVAPTVHHSRTFLSDIDGSVQLFSVAPWTGAPIEGGSGRPALILSLHGAGVEAINQARAYQPKDWSYVVAATNRRPYGFDWEDWGRLDALEVLAEAARLFGPDPARTYLTGHSMGGHGTWLVGATFPDLWAAIGPSAGWRSFSSYGGGPPPADPSPVEEMLLRAASPGETVELARNFLHYGIYILHGERDDNVPVAQARFMRELLGGFHPDFSYYERPGAGHWWGDECVDWPPLFEFFRRHVRPDDAAVDRIEFTTADPGISACSRWVTLLAQEHPLRYSRVRIERTETGSGFRGTTENVRRLALEVPGLTPADSVVVELDGTRLAVTPAGRGERLYFEHEAGGWRPMGVPDPALKGPARSGGFKDAFRNRVVLVYGTRGDDREDARAFAKARFDAEMFWYRGNGGVDVVADTEFDPAAEPDRNVVLYGNADTNALWRPLLGESPVQVRRGGVRAGERSWTGEDLGAYFIRPRPGSPTASVGAVAWTGPAGWSAAGAGQYFISGAGFPDLLLFSAAMLRDGSSGVCGVGFFGDDWSLERGEFVWAGPGG